MDETVELTKDEAYPVYCFRAPKEWATKLVLVDQKTLRRWINIEKRYYAYQEELRKLYGDGA